MKKETKLFLDELIDYRRSRTPGKYLKKAYEEIGDKAFVGLIGWILQWQKESFLQIGLRKDPNQFEINDALYSRYIEFFEKCPELLEIFKLEENKIIWAEFINEQEKSEIRKYVNQNYQLQFRSRTKRNLGNQNLYRMNSTNKHIIQDKMNVKGETALGIIFESQKSIASIREELHNKNIVVSGTKGKASGIIKSVDGYKANHDPTKNNLFILTDITNVADFEIGDSIEIMDN